MLKAVERDIDLVVAEVENLTSLQMSATSEIRRRAPRGRKANGTGATV